jgi:NAD-dependent SIR2 family protein deacetylase
MLIDIICRKAEKLMENVKTEVMEKIKEAQKVLIGIGKEWALRDDEKDIRFCHLTDPSQADLKAAYEALYDLIKEKDYYIVTTLTDGAVYEMPFDKNRIVAPCGNIHWRQCSKACTKDIWEESEVPDDVCPHCKAPLTGNTIKAETYIEEGYLPRWKDYMKWQTGTINRSLVILELGEGFATPTVMRWPFEKIIYFNRKSRLYRINESFYQLPKEAEERGVSVHENSVRWILEK